MPRIYGHKNSEELREKYEIVSLNFSVLRHTLRLWTIVFYSCVNFFHKVYSQVKVFWLISPNTPGVLIARIFMIISLFKYCA